MQNKIYIDNFTFSIDDIRTREEPRNVLLTKPDYFEVIDVKNAFMAGNEGITEHKKAIEQWNQLKNIYSQLTLYGVVEDVLELPGAKGLEDMVFCANQTFPWVKGDGEKVVVLSKMKHESRKKEVPFFEQFFKTLGYTPLNLKHTDLFEGMGDTIGHPFKDLLYGGFGHRSKENAHGEIAQLLNVPIILLELPHPKFYHLDTCFLPIDEDNIMLCREAFTNQGMESIGHFFKHMHFIDEEEASRTFCLNAHIPYNRSSKHVIIQKGSTTAISILTDLGFTIHETETSEYMKSGGSVFCMKMMVY